MQLEAATGEGTTLTFSLDREYALALDREDPLSQFRERFYVQPGRIYMDGNSLGLLSKDAEKTLLDALDQWRALGIDGWLQADPPWFYLGELLGEQSSALVGASENEIVVTGGTTVNLHSLVSSFYMPTNSRRKILADELDFPSDIYALEAQIENAGGVPERDLVKVQSRDGRMIEEDDVIAAMTDEVALVLLPSVLYRSGQLLDIERITAAAHERGILIGWDCCHSAGAVPHRFDEWEVDFAFWCNYKYLNAGPGSVGSLYVNKKHFGTRIALPGWWGYVKDKQFDMSHEFVPAAGASGWGISSLSVLSAAPLLGALNIALEAGIEATREKSLALTDYMIELIEKKGLTERPYNYSIGTPREHSRRGGHVAVEHERGPQIARALKNRGVIPDFRQPNVVRLAPIGLYSSFTDVWDTVEHLKQVVDTKEYLALQESRDVVA